MDEGKVGEGEGFDLLLREQDAFSPYSRIAYEGQMQLSAAQYSVFNRVTT